MEKVGLSCPCRSKQDRFIPDQRLDKAEDLFLIQGLTDLNDLCSSRIVREDKTFDVFVIATHTVAPLGSNSGFALHDIDECP